MGTMYKCVRIKNTKKPLKSRCNKPLGVNGILCDSCFAEAQRSKIPVLMCNDVFRVFNIPFKNQVMVWIDLSKNKNKTTDEPRTIKMKDIRNRISNELNKLPNKELNKLHLGLNLNDGKDYIRDEIIGRIIKKLLTK